MSGAADQRALAFLDDAGQLERLAAFRAAHPHVLVGGGEFGTWQALIPEENGETIIVRYALRELLDKLDDLLAPMKRETPSQPEPPGHPWRG